MGESAKYISDLFNYSRRRTIAVKVGNVEIGGDNPIRVQSMANTDTNDTKASVEQALKIEQAGGELVRFTAQGVKEATNLEAIRSELRKKGAKAPLVADIHFNPKAAEVAALYVEKVRINPGNFVDRVHTLNRFEYTDEEYQLEIEKIRTKLLPLLAICRENHTAIRIGVNHGSLSDRILSRYGDTPNGMVESCLEFLRICKEEQFLNVVISIKASNTVIMVQTVRLLVARMNEEGMKFPLHLGVTEAGDGEDGRVKSALGIGALLADGLGDTIRVSLSENPECEIPVARKLVNYVSSRIGHDLISAKDSGCVNPFVYQKRATCAVNGIGANNVPVVFMSQECEHSVLSPDFVVSNGEIEGRKIYSVTSLDKLSEEGGGHKYVELTYSDLTDEVVQQLSDDVVVILTTSHKNGVAEQRAFFHALMERKMKNPVIIKRTYQDNDIEDLQIKAGADYGQFFIDGLGDGIWIEAPNVQPSQVLSLSFGILQGARVRMSKTEYISCPSCGRTLFDLQSTIARIKEKTSHLKNLKIGIMGCIVNGPGEMADADYGYVGSAKGMVNLYKGQTCVEKLIPEEQAVDKLIELIKANGDWVD
ncbi:MAG: (E)-4-hydroxy-3-methylbut-2-enyl-diphosphate synthase [Paludibacteraceae bacterium]|nr:(E)-4-hydroxy-3-methylbut-2-enyl-diphosphate synthase [Paludibacteraceae bacterium]